MQEVNRSDADLTILQACWWMIPLFAHRSLKSPTPPIFCTRERINTVSQARHQSRTWKYQADPVCHWDNRGFQGGFFYKAIQWRIVLEALYCHRFLAAELGPQKNIPRRWDTLYRRNNQKHRGLAFVNYARWIWGNIRSDGEEQGWFILQARKWSVSVTGK